MAIQRNQFCLILSLVALLPTCSFAVKIADVTRIGGQRSNVLTGLGLVYGLKGSGDGGQFLPAMKPLASMLGKFADTSQVLDLGNVQNVALVSLTATVPGNGVRDGDHLDVYVTSLGAAKSLRGGRLFVTPMQGPMANSDVFALSEGPLVIEDTATPTVGVVKGGCVMERDLPAKFIEAGRFTLIVDDPSASWTMTSNIAKIINDAGDGDGTETIATAVDPKNVVVQIPAAERDRPDSFISRVQRLPVPILATEARVTINDRTGTIIMTGDVEISPVVISHKGMTITTVTPTLPPTPRNPKIETHDVLAIGTGAEQSNGKLQDLVNAMDQLKVPTEDRIAIIKELHETGKLHAKLIVE